MLYMASSRMQVEWWYLGDLDNRLFRGLLKQDLIVAQRVISEA
jgi:hypothetical protein